jgi:hypothetical protein
MGQKNHGDALKVAVLGCGPAGLIAAHSAVTMGHEVTVLSRKRRSPMFGAMYLHEPIPMISPLKPEMYIDVHKTGTRQGYAEKVYGDPEAPVSWDIFKEGETPGWDLKAAYAELWERYSDLIEDVQFTPESVSKLSREFDRVFTTIPATATCLDWRHEFKKVTIDVVHGPTGNEQNIMWYNGSIFHDSPAWYRYSRINRYESWEFGDGQIPANIPTEILIKSVRVSRGMKPLTTTCDCHPDIIRLGRFGKWDKHAFTHHAYLEVRNAL